MDNANQEQRSTLVLTVIVVLGLALGCVFAMNGGDYPFNNPFVGMWIRWWTLLVIQYSLPKVFTILVLIFMWVACWFQMRAILPYSMWLEMLPLCLIYNIFYIILVAVVLLRLARERNQLRGN